MAHRRPLVACLVAAALLVPGARADIAAPEPPRPCTLQARAQRGYDCTSCRVSVLDPDECRHKLEAAATGKPYDMACRGSGRTEWSEVWCRQHVRVPPPPHAWRRALADNVTVSSFLPDSAVRAYGAEQLVDADLHTAWQTSGGPGEHVQFDFDGGVTLLGVSIANGFQFDDGVYDRFRINGRMKSAHLVFSDGSEEKLAFAPDGRGMTHFAFRSRSATWVKLVVDEVYPGAKTKDLAISEIEFVVAEKVP